MLACGGFTLASAQNLHHDAVIGYHFNLFIESEG